MYRVDPSKCVGCGACEVCCPCSCIVLVDQVAVIDQKQCNGCGLCAEVCGQGAVAPAAPVVVVDVPPTLPALPAEPAETQPRWLKAVATALPAVAGVVVEAASRYLEARRGPTAHRQESDPRRPTRYRRRRGRG